jgi:hypothetical protein
VGRAALHTAGAAGPGLHGSRGEQPVSRAALQRGAGGAARRDQVSGTGVDIKSKRVEIEDSMGSALHCFGASARLGGEIISQSVYKGCALKCPGPCTAR